MEAIGGGGKAEEGELRRGRVKTGLRVLGVGRTRRLVSWGRRQTVNVKILGSGDVKLSCRKQSSQHSSSLVTQTKVYSFLEYWQ